MTPKEKAEELVNKYLQDDKFMFSFKQVRKQCALIAVDEILNDDWYIATYQDLISRKTYWQEVKQEIEKL